MSKAKSGSLAFSLKVIICVFLSALVLHLSLQNFRIQGQSMEPTLHDQEYVVVNRAAYLLDPPARGDIIVFRYPGDPNEDYVKRIIALPGDIISVIDETVIVDGRTLHEPYISPTNQGNPFPSFTQRIVAPGEYFVMGDNRDNSSDSRQWGFVPRENIIGKALIAYWPPGMNNLGLLPDASAIFAGIHQ